MEEDETKKKKKVLIIMKGFGGKSGGKYRLILEHFEINSPDTPEPSSGLQSGVEILKNEILLFRPDCVICSSRGGKFLLRLWELGIWKGPSVLLCSYGKDKPLPKGIPIVMQYGKKDISYSTRVVRKRLLTGTKGLVKLYITNDEHSPKTIVKNKKLVRMINEAIEMKKGGI